MTKTKTTFTPGPWRVCRDPRPDFMVEAKSGRKPRWFGDDGFSAVAVAQECTASRIAADQAANLAANTALIAAAPDMYAAGEAISAAAAEVEAMLDAGEAAPDDSAMWDAIATMRAALRRARGEG